MKEQDVSNIRFIGFIILIVSFSVIAFIFGCSFANQGQLPTIEELILYSALGMFVGLGFIFIDEFRIFIRNRREAKV